MVSAIPKTEVLQSILDQLSSEVDDQHLQRVPFNLAVFNLMEEAIESYDTHFSRYGLSQARFAILIVLHLYPKRIWTPADLAEQLSVTRATMTGLLRVCERNNHITRDPDPEDGRKSCIALTSSGKKLINGMLADHFRRTAEATTLLTDKEIQTLLPLLQKLVTGLSRLRPGEKEETNE